MYNPSKSMLAPGYLCCIVTLFMFTLLSFPADGLAKRKSRVFDFKKSDLIRRFTTSMLKKDPESILRAHPSVLASTPRVLRFLKTNPQVFHYLPRAIKRKRAIRKTATRLGVPTAYKLKRAVTARTARSPKARFSLGRSNTSNADMANPYMGKKMLKCGGKTTLTP